MNGESSETCLREFWNDVKFERKNIDADKEKSEKSGIEECNT